MKESKSIFVNYWPVFGLVWSDWDLIVRLVCHIYGVTTIADINDFKLDRANDTAKSITKVIFENSFNVMKEYEWDFKY